jgi:methionine-R-sulfoxide reductase
MMKLNKLTQAEKFVMIDGGQEMPFTGEYDQNFQKGVYACRHCGAPLYKSDRKFDASCGWPAFDQEIRGAVKRHLDPDGHRVAIRCAKCGAHLGHVFEGEGFTPKNVRHCVSSLSMRFIPSSKKAKTLVRRTKHAEVVHNGTVVDADNEVEKY